MRRIHASMRAGRSVDPNVLVPTDLSSITDLSSLARLATFDQAMAKLHNDVADLIPDS